VEGFGCSRINLRAEDRRISHCPGSDVARYKAAWRYRWGTRRQASQGPAKVIYRRTEQEYQRPEVVWQTIAFYSEIFSGKALTISGG